MPLFELISVPPFYAVLVEHWNAPAHRYFLAYRATGTFRHVLGLPVVDEFATFSTPIFFGPVSALGMLYNTGITLGHQRNPEMPLDQGWPPICVGIETESEISSGWETRLLDAITKVEWKPSVSAADFVLEHRRIGNVDVYATDAPLLPRQLQRICQISNAPFSIAFSTGNRITAQKGKLLTIQAASELTVESLLKNASASAK